MGQVPFEAQILVVGDGRLAETLLSVLQRRNKAEAATHSDSAGTNLDGDTERSLAFCKPLRFASWSRRLKVSFTEFQKTFTATHVWLAISDHALRDFVMENVSSLEGRTVVHFAGSLSSFEVPAGSGHLKVHAAHPLTTFANSTTSAVPFSKVPIVLDRDGPDLDQLMPGFNNPTYRLKPDDRAYYHALCAAAGNFSVLLWEGVAQRFESRLGLNADALSIFRSQIFENLAQAQFGDSVLTGPLVRGDVATIESHRHALRERGETALLKIYDGFSELYLNSKADFDQKEST